MRLLAAVWFTRPVTDKPWDLVSTNLLPISPAIIIFWRSEKIIVHASQWANTIRHTAMPSSSDITCFGAVPAPLPNNLIEDAARALVNFRAWASPNIHICRP